MRSGIYLMKTSSQKPHIRVSAWQLSYLIYLQDGIVLDEKAKEA